MIPKIASIINMPAPYREKMHELLSVYFDRNYTVVYCAEREANRKWNINYGNYDKIVLSKINKNGIHNNIEIVNILKSINPDVIIIMGFFPTMLYSFIWAMVKQKKFIVFTDGTLKSESGLSYIHKIIRKIVFRNTIAFIGPANGSADLYKSYGIKDEQFFKSYLCANNDLFHPIPWNDKKYDLMFSGQFIERKMPFFFIDVVLIVREKIPDLKILILGDGPLKNDIIAQLNKSKIAYDYPGFIKQEELPRFYAKSKLFLFPTQNDPWGVVANEAMAAGVPVITCENAGAANDLVLDGENGFVLPLQEDIWAKNIIETLNNKTEYQRLSNNALAHVKKYNYISAAKGVEDAISYSFKD